MLIRVKVAMETFVHLTAYPHTHPTLYGWGYGKKKEGLWHELEKHLLI